MEEERKKLLFVFVFSTYLPIFLLKFRSGELVGCEIWFRIQRVPTLHTFDEPRYPKNKKYLKKHDHDIIITFFPGISCFLGTKVHQKYSVWVLVGCGIKFCIWTTSPDRNLSKNTMTKKVVFFNDKYVNSTVMVDLFYWNSIGSWIPTHKKLFWHVFL